MLDYALIQRLLARNLFSLRRSPNGPIYRHLTKFHVCVCVFFFFEKEIKFWILCVKEAIASGHWRRISLLLQYIKSSTLGLIHVLVFILGRLIITYKDGLDSSFWFLHSIPPSFFLKETLTQATSSLNTYTHTQTSDFFSETRASSVDYHQRREHS